MGSEKGLHVLSPVLCCAPARRARLPRRVCVQLQLHLPVLQGAEGAGGCLLEERPLCKAQISLGKCPDPKAATTTGQDLRSSTQRSRPIHIKTSFFVRVHLFGSFPGPLPQQLGISQLWVIRKATSAEMKPGAAEPPPVAHAGLGLRQVLPALCLPAGRRHRVGTDYFGSGPANLAQLRPIRHSCGCSHARLYLGRSSWQLAALPQPRGWEGKAQAVGHTGACGVLQNPNDLPRICRSCRKFATTWPSNGKVVCGLCRGWCCAKPAALWVAAGRQGCGIAALRKFGVQAGVPGSCFAHRLLVSSLSKAGREISGWGLRSSPALHPDRLSSASPESGGTRS